MIFLRNAKMIETKQITGCQALGTGFGTKEKEGPF
jgi:hypothetical protein